MVGLKTEAERPNLHYNLINPETNIDYDKPKMGWRYDINTMKRLINEKRIIWPESADGRPRRKVFLNELNDTLPGFSSIVGEDIFTRNGTAEIDALLGSRVFDFPKPSSLITELIDQVVEDGDIVLDFFAGSGPTGQSVFNINQINGRKISFILVQIPEATDKKSEAFAAHYKKISDITIERNKRVVEKLIAEKKNQGPNLFTNGQNTEGSLGLGFKVFKLVKSNFPRVEFAPDPEKTDAENIELLKKYISEKEAQLYSVFNRDELLTEILLKNHFTLNYAVKQATDFKKNDIFHVTDGNKETFICLDTQLDMETVEYFKIHTAQKFICLERALNTTMKWNLKHYMGDKFSAF